MSEKPCHLCDGFIEVGEDEDKWGIEWSHGWVHFTCIYTIFDALRRVEGKPEVAVLEAEIAARKTMSMWAHEIVAWMQTFHPDTYGDYSEHLPNIHESMGNKLEQLQAQVAELAEAKQDIEDLTDRWQAKVEQVEAARRMRAAMETSAYGWYIGEGNRHLVNEFDALLEKEK